MSPSKDLCHQSGCAATLKHQPGQSSRNFGRALDPQVRWTLPIFGEGFTTGVLVLFVEGEGGNGVQQLFGALLFGRELGVFTIPNEELPK